MAMLRIDYLDNSDMALNCLGEKVPNTCLGGRVGHSNGKEFSGRVGTFGETGDRPVAIMRSILRFVL